MLSDSSSTSHLKIKRHITLTVYWNSHEWSTLKRSISLKTFIKILSKLRHLRHFPSKKKEMVCKALSFTGVHRHGDFHEEVVGFLTQMSICLLPQHFAQQHHITIGSEFVSIKLLNFKTHLKFKEMQCCFSSRKLNCFMF